MTGKERLKEIKERVLVDRVYYKYLDGTKGHWGKTYTLDEEDYKYLYEQAKRAQELENHIDHLYDNNIHLKGDYRLQEQNKRYRRALERIKLNVKICGNEEYFPKVVEEIINEALEGEE